MPTPQTDPPWHNGQIRLFLSHSAIHKPFAGEVSYRLATVGVSAFVAHDAMEVTRPWQAQIEHALNTAEVFAALLHPEVNDSAWCQQEIGWALGRGLPIYLVRIGADPRGFPGGTQWPSAFGQDAQHVARLIAGWLNTQQELGPRVTAGLLAALEGATSYADAEEAARGLDAIGTLTPAQWDHLDAIFVANSQVGGSVLATRALRPLYERAGRSFPDRTGSR